MGTPIQAVLFDLDGTLIDSAPDLVGAGNDMRLARGLPPLAYEHFRPMVGAGARGMIGIALQVTPDHAEFADLRDEFLSRYEARMTQLTCIFEGMPPVLASLQRLTFPWGIVTNKATRFTEPLVRQLGLVAAGAATVISGDTTPHSKPHPAPLIEAARQLGVDAARCIYVGDDLRDVQAAHAAGMHAVVAAWGYLGNGDPIERWGAEHVIKQPRELLNVLGMT